MTTQLATRRVPIAANDPPLGWKVGFGALAAMAKFNTIAPLVGYLMRSGQLANL